MRGQVLGVDTRSGDGLIAGDDGQRYTFAPADWADRGEPAIGANVDFEPEGRGARNIFPLLPAVVGERAVAAPRRADVPTTDRNKVIAALLAFFFGPLGIDRFYLGKNGSGIVMLLLSITVIGLVLTYPLSFVNMIRYLMMGDREFAGRYPRG